MVNIPDEFVIKFVISGSRKNMDMMSVFKHPPINEIWEKSLAGELDSVKVTLQNLKETNEQFRPQIVDYIAERLHQYKHPKKALEIYQFNAALYPELSWVKSKLALSYRENRNLKKCKSWARKALELDPQDALALELLK